MTDEEIIKLAEKTREEKYCTQNTICVCEESAIYDCDSECPISYCDDCNTLCGDTIYEQGFLDGFKAAAEYINKIPHFPLKNDSDIERIEKFRDNPELCQTYLRELKDNIECMINGILAREK